jgi:hypothetical protein
MACDGSGELRRRATLSTDSQQSDSIPCLFRQSSHLRSPPPVASSFAELGESDSAVALGPAVQRREDLPQLFPGFNGDSVVGEQTLEGRRRQMVPLHYFRARAGFRFQLE